MWGSQSESIGGNGYESSVSSINQGVKVEGFEQKDRSWYVTTDVPSDLLVQVGDSSFHLHKYPLITKSGKINKLIYESRESDMNKIELTDLPGGAETFEFAVKFCYGVAIEISASNISGLRCASEYLEMTEDFEEGNLILKTESFLSYVVFASWKDSILVLKSCEQLSPWAENLQIVRRCCECIAWKACTNLRAINWSYTQKPIKGSSFRLNEIKESNPQNPPDWWFEDVSIFRIHHFVRIITAVKVKGMKFELIGAAIMRYAEKWLSGLMKEEITQGRNSTDDSNTNGVSSWKGGLHMIVAGNKEETLDDQVHERMIIESLVSLIPQQKDSVSCNFLLRILSMANKLKVAPALVTELEKRVGMQLEQAELADLIVTSYNKSETLYDVDLVQRLLEHFLVQEQIEDPSSPSRQSFSETARCKGTNAKMKVARLLDSYLSEVSRDKNFSMMKFQVLAEALPESARTCDDGLYRAVDSYLKAHPTLSEHDRKRLCRVMDCQKLSIDACMHAAQNERLPLRVAVQVLLSQQVKISNAISKASTNEPQYQATISPVKTFIEDIPLLFQEGLETSKKDINSLKFELESVKAKYLELQNDLENLQSHFEKMAQHKPSSAWTSGWRKLGRLTKLTTIETQDTASPSTRADQNKKSRRWRNSIS